MDLEKGVEHKGEFGAQISQLESLVEQMKEGFIQAMEELSLIQDGDRLLQKKVDDNKQEADQKMEELAKSVHQIREDLNSVLTEVQKSNKATERLAEQFERLRREHGRMRRRLKQTEQNLENQRQNQRRPSMSQSAKSDGEASKNGNNHKKMPDNDLLRRRKSTPGAYFVGREGHERRSVIQESETPMSPIMQSFMDSLPDPNDLNNNVGNTVNFDSPDGTPSRQIEFSPQHNGGSTNSSENDSGEREQRRKSFSPNRRVSFSNVNWSPDSNDKTEGQRLRLAEEFLLSERKYVGQLNALLENIMLPLVTESLIHPSEINIIFPECLAKMFDRHCCLLCALETRLSDAKWQGMHGDIFPKFAGVESANFLSQYGSYISSFPESLSLLSHHTRKSAKLTNFLKKQLADIEDEQADLLGYLLAPIQRIPAYVLHLKTVLELTDADHPDHYHVESCLTHLGGFLATMNPAIEQAVEAARTHKLFLSERRSLASTYPPHIIMSSQSSSLNKDSGVQSMEDESPYNRYGHHPSSQENTPGVVHDGMNGFHSTWTGSPARQRKSPSHGHTLPNGYRRNRRASLPGISLFESERVGNPEVVARSSPRTSKQHRGRMGRRGSYDQRMLNETYPVSTHHASMSGDIPGMTYIPEQTSNEVESAYRPHDPNRHRSSRSQNNLTEIPRYGIYREHDANGEMGYEPSSPSSALPRARQTGANPPQRSPRHRRQVGSPQSSSSSSRTSTPRDDYYQEDAGTNIIFEESDLHHHHHRRQQQKYRQRSASGSSKLLKVQDLGSEERAGSTVQLQRTGKSEHRRRAHSIPHLNRVGMPESAKPGILKDVWNESKPVNGSAEILTPRTNVKANPNRSPRDNPTSTGKSAKKSNFLTGSLRNIFFGKNTGYGRKRGSHVVELDDAPSHSTNSSTTDSTTTQMKSDTYHDEDGQPCSNV